MVTFNSLSLSPYPTVSPTPYNLPLSHNIFVTVKETTDRRHIVPNAQPKSMDIYPRKICGYGYGLDGKFHIHGKPAQIGRFSEFFAISGYDTHFTSELRRNGWG